MQKKTEIYQAHNALRQARSRRFEFIVNGHVAARTDAECGEYSSIHVVLDKTTVPPVYQTFVVHEQRVALWTEGTSLAAEISAAEEWLCEPHLPCKPNRRYAFTVHATKTQEHWDVEITEQVLDSHGAIVDESSLDFVAPHGSLGEVAARRIMVERGGSWRVFLHCEGSRHNQWVQGVRSTGKQVSALECVEAETLRETLLAELEKIDCDEYKPVTIDFSEDEVVRALLIRRLEKSAAHTSGLRRRLLMRRSAADVVQALNLLAIHEPADMPSITRELDRVATHSENVRDTQAATRSKHLPINHMQALLERTAEPNKVHCESCGYCDHDDEDDGDGIPF